MAEKPSWFDRIWNGAREIWEERAPRSHEEASRLYRFIHFWVLVGKSFMRNRCSIRAAALSYTTLLALIPMLAVAISVTSSLLKKEGEREIYGFIDRFVSTLVPPATDITNNVPATGAGAPPTSARDASDTSVAGLTNRATPGMTGASNTISAAADEPAAGNAPAKNAKDRVTVVQQEAASYIHQFIQNTSSGAVSVVGMLGLIAGAILMLGRIEETFNDIWGITRRRGWRYRIPDYCFVLTLGPVLLAGAAALASGPYLHTTQAFTHGMPFISGLVFKLLPLALLWLAFAAFYKVVPNTKVRFDAAFVGGFVGGSLWHLNNFLGFLYVPKFVTNNKIYGGIGLALVFMFGLYLSWLILLFGAQVAYAYQNRALYLQEKLIENVNQRGREFIALRLMTCMGHRFQQGLKPPTITEMSTELGVPSRLVQQVLQTLLAARLVMEVTGAEPGYSPARPLDSINAHHVLMAMRAAQGQELVTRDEPVRSEVFGEYARIEEAEKQTASSINLLTLVNRTHALAALNPAREKPEDLKLSPALVPHQEDSTAGVQEGAEPGQPTKPIPGEKPAKPSGPRGLPS